MEGSCVILGPKYLVDEHRAGNYVVRLRSNGGTASNKIYETNKQERSIVPISPSEKVVNLYFIDTGSRTNVGGRMTSYAWPLPAQLKWLESASRSIVADVHRKDGIVNRGLAFIHVPFPEFELAVHQNPISGTHGEKVSSSNLNGGLFSTIMSTSEIHGVFGGHDHLNDYCALYYGVQLCYAGGVGYQGYSKPNWPRRLRIIELSKFGEAAATWKRLDIKSSDTDSEFDDTSKIDVEYLWSDEVGMRALTFLSSNGLSPNARHMSQRINMVDAIFAERYVIAVFLAVVVCAVIGVPLTRSEATVAIWARKVIWGVVWLVLQICTVPWQLMMFTCCRKRWKKEALNQ
eukprot:GHVO01064839.1.p1 GENE.GHVO01064839.1~~GHVO01064839.1.p1  ORF type:complete len:394 (-),score=70.77 GHVO01064839.1:232-1269(-)